MKVGKRAALRHALRAGRVRRPGEFQVPFAAFTLPAIKDSPPREPALLFPSIAALPRQFFGGWAARATDALRWVK
jgi:hypothetical protein